MADTNVTSKAGKRKVAQVMGEFKAGKLNTDGKKVTAHKQALAIAMSEGHALDAPKGAQVGAIVGPQPGPLSANLPGPQAAPAPPPPEVLIETAADIIKAAMGELRAQGVFPPLGGAPISAPLGVQAPPPTALG